MFECLSCIYYVLAKLFEMNILFDMCKIACKKMGDGEESPVWYVEPCGGEGEYHVSRMRSEIDERPPMKWPKVEETRRGMDSSSFDQL